ncbi:hypothetical protein Q9L58_002609 [Maublancomyces gigas]|uniref:Cytochrome P450 n=1 Tax=Discina gigas TaxID=1032678 RepID=A0ABR3GRF3_9PEZI
MLPVIYHRYADKTNYYLQAVGAPTAFTCLKHKDHTIARRRISGPFSAALLPRIEDKIDTWLHEWTDKLRDEFSETGESKNFNNQTIWLVYDMVSDITYGRPFGFLATSSDVNGIINCADSNELFQNAVNMIPSLLWLLKNTWLGHFVLPKRDHLQEAKRLAVLDEVDSSTGQGLNIPRMLLKAKAADGTSMTIDEVASESRILLTGGADPIVSTTIELLANIVGNPSCYEKLAAEINEAECNRQLSNPVATFEEAQSLPYLTACIRETFRGAETTITMIPRAAQKGGVQILGQFVPEGTHLSATPWITHRNRAMYGEDAEIFRPERWLEAGSEQLQQWKKYDFQFGYGSRACPGKTIAHMAIYKLSLQILRAFKLRRLNEDCARGDCFTRHVDDKSQRDLGLSIERLRGE